MLKKDSLYSILIMISMNQSKQWTSIAFINHFTPSTIPQILGHFSQSGFEEECLCLILYEMNIPSWTRAYKNLKVCVLYLSLLMTRSWYWYDNNITRALIVTTHWERWPWTCALQLLYLSHHKAIQATTYRLKLSWKASICWLWNVSTK